MTKEMTEKDRCISQVGLNTDVNADNNAFVILRQVQKGRRSYED